MACVGAMQGRHTPPVIAFCVEPIWERHCFFFEANLGGDIKANRTLFVDKDCRIILTGSNGNLLAGTKKYFHRERYYLHECATRLTLFVVSASLPYQIGILETICIAQW
jgi:hypothetical protein